MSSTETIADAARVGTVDQHAAAVPPAGELTGAPVHVQPTAARSLTRRRPGADTLLQDRLDEQIRRRAVWLAAAVLVAGWLLMSVQMRVVQREPMLRVMWKPQSNCS